MLKNRIKNKYFLVLFLSVILIGIIVGVILLIMNNRGSWVESIEKVCPNCNFKGFKTERIGENIFKETLGFSAIATASGGATRYFNWTPVNFCSEKKCYLKNITAKVTFMNSGNSSVVSHEGAAYIQIANSQESNCVNPSQASFKRYLAYAPALAGGKSWTQDTCGENTNLNSCELTKLDGFSGKSDCFSLKLYAPNINNGETNFADILLFLTYTYEIE